MLSPSIPGVRITTASWPSSTSTTATGRRRPTPASRPFASTPLGSRSGSCSSSAILIWETPRPRAPSSRRSLASIRPTGPTCSAHLPCSRGPASEPRDRVARSVDSSHRHNRWRFNGRRRLAAGNFLQSRRFEPLPVRLQVGLFHLDRAGVIGQHLEEHPSEGSHRLVAVGEPMRLIRSDGSLLRS